MKITGIIAEYNPFHNGHKYQIDTIRMGGSDYVIAVISGDFTQRGEPAIVNKYARTEMALKGGVDLVLELPVAFATADAGRFATGGVSLLNNLGVVDELAFGVEEGNEETVVSLAEFLSDPPALYDATLDDYLRKGYSYLQTRYRYPSLRNNQYIAWLGKYSVSTVRYVSYTRKYPPTPVAESAT